MAKTTKEDLTILNVQLEKAVQKEQAKDERIRREFTKAFNWRKNDRATMMGPSSLESNDPILPTWEQIFVELGELKADANYSILLKQKRELEHSLAIMIDKDQRKQKGVCPACGAEHQGIGGMPKTTLGPPN